MTQRSAFSRALIPSVGMAVALGATPLAVYAAPAPQDASPTRVGTVSFDRQAGTLVIPVEGSAPIVQVRKLAAHQYVADLANSVLVMDQVQGQRLAGAPIAGWSLDETPHGQTVRLRLTTSEDARPTIQVTHEAGRLLVRFHGPLAQSRLPNLQATASADRRFPVAPPVHRSSTAQRFAVGKHVGWQGQYPMAWPSATPGVPEAVRSARKARVSPVRHASRPAAPAIKTAVRPAVKVERQAPAVLNAVRVDKARHLLVVPVAKGQVPIHDLKVVRLNQRWAYVDIPGAKPSFTGVKYQNKPDPLLERWVMAKRPGRDVTRVSFALANPADLDVKVEARQVLIAVRPKTMVLGAAPVKPAAKPAPVAKAAAPRVAALPAPRLPRMKIATSQLRRPFFDENRYGLVVPYQGEVPLYRMNRVDAKRVVLELKGDIAHASALVQTFRHHPLMASWSLEPRKATGTVRIGLNFRRDAELVIGADAARNQLLLIPQPTLAQAGPPVASKPETWLGQVQRDPASDHVYIPFKGELPAYTVEQVSGSFANIRFEKSKLERDGVQFYSPDFHPTLNYWLFADRGHDSSVSLSLALTQPGGAMVYEDRANHRLVVMVGGQVPQAKVNARSAPLVPGPWVQPVRPAAAKPALPTVGLSRRAS